MYQSRGPNANRLALHFYCPKHMRTFLKFTVELRNYSNSVRCPLTRTMLNQTSAQARPDSGASHQNTATEQNLSLQQRYYLPLPRKIRLDFFYPRRRASKSGYFRSRACREGKRAQYLSHKHE